MACAWVFVCVFVFVFLPSELCDDQEGYNGKESRRGFDTGVMALAIIYSTLNDDRSLCVSILSKPTERRVVGLESCSSGGRDSGRRRRCNAARVAL